MESPPDTAKDEQPMGGRPGKSNTRTLAPSEHFDSASELMERAKSAMAGRRVLVAEADGHARRTITTTFKKVAAQVHEAGDGGQAVHALYQAYEQDEPIELVVLGLAMPRLGGMAVLDLMRKDEALAQTPVVVLTAVKDERVLDRCVQLGAAAVLAKPQMPQQILDAAIQAMKEAGSDVGASPPAAAAERGSEPPPDGVSQLDFPIDFEGLPDPASYALRKSHLRCPFCSTVFTAPRLDHRALKADPDDHYGVGLHEGPLEKPFLEYFVIEMIVCPGCLYTHDRAGFDRLTRAGGLDLERVRQLPDDRWQPCFLPVDAGVRKAMARQADQRLRIARRAGDDGAALFRINAADPATPRSHDDALVGFDLALACVDVLAEHYVEEAGARVRHRGVAFLLKRSHCYRLLARADEGSDAGAAYEARRIEDLRQASEMILTVEGVELRVLGERLRYLTRCFFLADELIEHTDDANARQSLEEERRQAWIDMRAILFEQRKAGCERGENTARRLLDALDRRMHRITQGRQP